MPVQALFTEDRRCDDNHRSIKLKLALKNPNSPSFYSTFFSCRPYDIPFYVGVLVPFAVIYIFNCIIFVIVMVSLIKKQQNKEVQTAPKGMKTRLKQRLIIVVTLSLLLGLGWGLGIPATEGIDNLVVRTTFQIVFIFLTAFQGLFIFIMHCVRVPDARKVWRYWFSKMTFHSEAAYSKSTLSRSGAAGFVYKETTNKAGTLTTSVAGGDSSTLRQSSTKGALSTYEPSTLRYADSAFSSMLESETAFNEMEKQDTELLSKADGKDLPKEESKNETHMEVKRQISGLPEMPSRQEKVKETMKAAVSVSDKSFNTYGTAMEEFRKHKKVTERLQSLDEEEGADTIFANPAADLGEEGIFDPLTDYEQRIRLMSEESTQSYHALLLELGSKMSPSEHMSTPTTDHETIANAKETISPVDNTTAVNTTAIEEGNSSQRQQNSSTDTSEVFNIWYNTNPDTFSLELSGEEPGVERIEVTKL